MNCPKCGKDITHLRHVQSGSNFYDCWLEKRTDCNGKPYDDLDYQHDEFETDGNVNEWYCPECKATLFGSEDEALDFLRGA